MRKTILGVVLIIMTFLLPSICLAGEKPFGKLTSTQQVIDKLFAGRALDPIEGIWVRDEKNVIAIFKASLVNIQDPKYENWDYFGVYVQGGSHGGPGEIFLRLKRTEYGFSFINQQRDYWKLLSPTVLQFDGNYGINYGLMNCEVFIRTYPNP